MYSSLSTHCYIRVLHGSKQCYSSLTPRPFSSCAVFAFTSSQGAKSANMENVQELNCVYCEETTRKKRHCELGHCPNSDFVLSEIRPILPQGLTHCLSVNTNHVCIHSHTQTSTFANDFTDFLNVLVGFRSRRVTWMLIIFHFLPTLTKSFVPFKHM